MMKKLLNILKLFSRLSFLEILSNNHNKSIYILMKQVEDLKREVGFLKSYLESNNRI